MPDILYHYCTSQTFASIINNRSLWLSSMSLSNDSMEGRHVIETFIRMARDASFPASAVEKIQQSLTFFSQKSDGFGFCLSEEGDLLSQWRGYAGDGTGISIGFSREYLKWLGETAVDGEGFGVIQVLYDPISQQESVRKTFAEVETLIREGAFSETGAFVRGLLSYSEEDVQKKKDATEKAHSILINIFPKLYTHKSNAFQEEREWRLLNYWLRSETCEFRADLDRIIPYRNFKLHELNRGPIKEVILGPKHITPVEIIQEFLRIRGFGDVFVRRSNSTYR